MRLHVQKWGNSLALRIPRALATESHIEQGSVVEVSLREGTLVVAPVENLSYTLEDLLAGVTAENLHREVDTGAARGAEGW